MRALIRLAILLALLLPAATRSGAQPPASPAAAPAAMPVTEDRFWNDQFGPPGGSIEQVYASAISPAGELIIGGQNGVRRWDGRRWHELGVNAPINSIYALAFVGSTLYAGGSFSSAGGAVVNNLARWDGTSWRGVGAGVTRSASQAVVLQLEARNGRLYVAGHFDRAGGTASNGLAVWDGSAWVAPEGGGLPGPAARLVAITFDQGRLYASSSFSETGKYKAKTAVWDGQAWTQLGPTFESSGGMDITDLQWYAGQLYMSGGFFVPGESAISYVARWDGARWQGIAGSAETHSGTYAMVVRGGLLYVGTFTNPGERLLLAWNGSAWSRSGPLAGAGTIIRAFAQTASSFYIGGYIASLLDNRGNEQRINHVAQLLDGEWWPLGGGIETDTIWQNRIMPVGDDVYLFVGSNESRVWNGRHWRSLGRTFLPGSAASDGRALYATNNGNTVVRRDGDAWVAIGTANGTVMPIGGESGLYVAGAITEIDGVAVNHLARWDGSAWHPLGAIAPNGSLHGAHVTAAGIYVAGVFTSVGTISANHIAYWDGAAWGALGAGIPETEFGTIAGSDNDLYVKSEDQTTVYVRHWDGAAWTTLIAQPRQTMAWSDIAVLDGDLVLSGGFTSIGGVAANYIARWDGSAWHALGSGTEGPAKALAAKDHNLYAFGGFRSAGGAPSQQFAQWNNYRKPVFIPAVLR